MWKYAIAILAYILFQDLIFDPLWHHYFPAKQTTEVVATPAPSEPVASATPTAPVAAPSAPAKFLYYDSHKEYLGYIPVDSAVISYESKNIKCYYHHNLVYSTNLCEMGYTMMDKRK